MNATVCPINPPGHDWQAGLSCRWCDATRTPSETVLSGLASVRGWSREAARTVRDAHRAEVLAEAADYVEQRRLTRADIVTDFDRGRRAAEGCVVEELRELAGEAAAAAATATPEDFFVAGRTYTRTDRTGLHLRFVCEHLTTDPKVGDREAWGWLHRSDGTRRMQRMWDHDYPTWTPKAGESRG